MKIEKDESSPNGSFIRINAVSIKSLSAVKIAKLAGVPIVPLVWYSSNFNLVKFNSWDRLQVPFLDVRLINLYGEPIYVPADGDEASDEEYRLKLEKSLLELRDRAPEEYKKVYWHGLWKRRIK